MRGLIVDRSVHLDARNHEVHTAVESFVQQVARYEGIGESRIGVDSFVHRSVHLDARNHEAHTVVKSFVQQVARYEGIVNYASELNHSCIKMHVTRESRITYRG